MDWNNKTELAKLLNNQKYEEAISMFSKEDEWDYQAIEIFVTGFDITKCDLLEPIKDRFLKLEDEKIVDSLSFRSSIRLLTIIEILKSPDKLNR